MCVLCVCVYFIVCCVYVGVCVVSGNRHVYVWGEVMCVCVLEALRQIVIVNLIN